MKPLFTMREAVSDPNLLGRMLEGDSWRPWRIVLIGLMGEPLADDEAAVWQQLTGRPYTPGIDFEEFWAIVGRRGGKTRAMACLSAYLASLCDWSDSLVPGEVGRLVYLAATARQASIALGYASAIYNDTPFFHRQVVGQTTEGLTLRNGIEIEVRPASFKNLRGITAIATICDEIAFWDTGDAANPDSEILDALRPSLATTRGRLIAISSPFARRGELFETFEAHHGEQGDPRIIVIHAPTRVMNASLPQEIVERAMARDAAVARAEWLAQWREDIEGFVSLDAVRACIVPTVIERDWRQGCQYVAFVDPSGGSSDAMTMAIAHQEDGVAVLDRLCVVEPPFDPMATVLWLCGQLRDYGLRSVSGDGYGAVWVRDAFERQGVRYHSSKLSRTEIYLGALPMINSTMCRLLDDDRLVQQLVGLERRVSRTGRESVDHRPGQHDDIANAAAGALVLAAEEPDLPTALIGNYGGDGTLYTVGGDVWAPGADRQGRTSSLFSGPDYIRDQIDKGKWRH